MPLPLQAPARQLLLRSVAAPPNKSLQRTGPQCGAIDRDSLWASFIEPPRAGHRARPLSSRSLGCRRLEQVRTHRRIPRLPLRPSRSCPRGCTCCGPRSSWRARQRLAEGSTLGPARYQLPRRFRQNTPDSALAPRRGALHHGGSQHRLPDRFARVARPQATRNVTPSRCTGARELAPGPTSMAWSCSPTSRFSGPALHSAQSIGVAFGINHRARASQSSGLAAELQVVGRRAFEFHEPHCPF